MRSAGRLPPSIHTMLCTRAVGRLGRGLPDGRCDGFRARLVVPPAPLLGEAASDWAEPLARRGPLSPLPSAIPYVLDGFETSAVEVKGHGHSLVMDEVIRAQREMVGIGMRTT